jgi:hypothetical protein
MTKLKISITGKDKYIAGMTRALAFWSAPNQRAGQASVSGSRLDESGIIVLRFNTEGHLAEFKRVLDKYLPGSTAIVD